MAIERSSATGNNSFPETVYDTVAVDEGKWHGTPIAGHGDKASYEVEYFVDFSSSGTKPGGSADARSDDNKAVHEIPIGAVPIECRYDVLTAVTGGTPTLTVGLIQSDGSAIDVDGLVTELESPTAGGSHISGTGALLGTATTVKSNLLVTSDATAGLIKVRLKYHTQAK